MNFITLKIYQIVSIPCNALNLHHLHVQLFSSVANNNDGRVTIDVFVCAAMRLVLHSSATLPQRATCNRVVVHANQIHKPLDNDYVYRCCGHTHGIAWYILRRRSTTMSLATIWSGI